VNDEKIVPNQGKNGAEGTSERVKRGPRGRYLGNKKALRKLLAHEIRALEADTTIPAATRHKLILSASAQLGVCLDRDLEAKVREQQAALDEIARLHEEHRKRGCTALGARTAPPESDGG
jgi:hypothetical protein